MNLLEQEIKDKILIKKLIPQRDPMIMVDSLFYYDKTKVIGGLTINNSNLFVKDGFLNESGILEHMAQTVALHTGYSFYINNLVAPEGYIGAISNVIITKLPMVNDKLKTEIKISKKFLKIVLVEGKTLLNNEVIMTATMKTVEK
tara:strand:+ start:518 stop:952 length:435 start_codon:yes stop_codon:yes gene_type:complete